MKGIKWSKLILLIVIIQVFFSSSFGNEVYAIGSISGQVIDTYSNEIYNSNIVRVNGSINDNRTENNTTFYSFDSAASYFRNQMVQRKKKITFTINQQYYNGMSTDLFNKAIGYNDNLSSDEGDYLKEHFSKFKCEISYYNDGTTTLSYKMEYLTDYSQENAVSKEVKNVLDKLNVYNADEYNKVKTVHDYIVTNIKYDESYSKYSAYNAIIDKDVVCQGFASLTYRMLKDLGVGVRVITGKNDNGINHAWNIVRIDGKWYNVDNTWDENLSSNRYISYNYFLKNNKDFPRHIRDGEYCSSQFNYYYPISDSSYILEEELDGKKGMIYFPEAMEDVNGDGVVDTLDLADTASMYNIDSLNPRWDKRYDFNNDDIIDIYDIVLVSEKIGI